MASATKPMKSVLPKTEGLVEMNWDPITRIVGSLGIFTKIDFKNREVRECYSASSIFRGYSVFMKGKDPRDAHFITSRICGICGDNHATCAVYAQNMAFGVRPPNLARVDHQPRRGGGVHVRPQHLIRTTSSAWTTASRWSGRPTPACGRRRKTDRSAERQASRLSNHRRHYDGAQSVQRRVLSRNAANEPADARNVLSDGRPPRPSFDALSRRRGHSVPHCSYSPITSCG